MGLTIVEAVLSYLAGERRGVVDSLPLDYYKRWSTGGLWIRHDKAPEYRLPHHALFYSGQSLLKIRLRRPTIPCKATVKRGYRPGNVWGEVTSTHGLGLDYR